MRKVSASQISTFEDCPRKWAYSRTIGEPEKPWLKLGTEVHLALKRWLLYGEAPSTLSKAGKAALSGIHLLPKPMRPDMTVEGIPIGGEDTEGEEYDDQSESNSRFHYWYDGVEYTGQMDFHLPGFVGDHKTCRTFDYMHDEASLRDNVQWALYSHVAAATEWQECVRRPEHPHPREIRGRWVYYSTGQVGQARYTDIRDPIDLVTRRFLDIHHRTGKRLSVITDNPNEHTRNFDACGKYGGCPFKEPCYEGTSIVDRISAAMSQHQQPAPGGLLEAHGQPAAYPPVAPVAYPPAPPPAAPQVAAPPVAPPAEAAPPAPEPAPKKRRTRAKKPAETAPQAAPPVAAAPPPPEPGIQRLDGAGVGAVLAALFDAFDGMTLDEAIDAVSKVERRA